MTPRFRLTSWLVVPLASALVGAALVTLGTARALRHRHRDPATACAPCHGGGSPDGLYAEWRRSPWAAGSDPLGCGACHTSGTSAEACLEAWSARKPRSHRSRSPAASVRLSAFRTGRSVVVEATVVNTGTGHGLPGTARHELTLEIRLRTPRGRTVAPVAVTSHTRDTRRGFRDRGPLAPFASRIDRHVFPDPERAVAAAEATLRLVPVAGLTPESKPHVIQSVCVPVASDFP